MSNIVRPFGMRDKIGYASGDLGCNLSFSLISGYLMFFYTQYIGISIEAWAGIILALKVWDAINDPLMGAIIDSHHIGKGTDKFKPWIKIGSFGLIISAALVFMPIPNARMWVKIVVCFLTYLLWDVCYTIVNVPYGAMNSAISADSDQRASLSTWRSIGAAVGGALVMALPLIVYDDNDVLLGKRLLPVACVMGVMAFGAYSLLQKLTVERVHAVAPSEKYSVTKTLKGVIRNRPLMAIGVASFALLVFFSSTATTNNLVFQTLFHNTKVLPLATVASYLPMAICVPFVGKIVKKYGKKAAAGYPLLLSIVTCVVMLFIPLTEGSAYGPYVWIGGLMLINLGGGIFTLVCWAIVADCIDWQELKTGLREEGSIYAVYSLFRKLAQGVGASLIALLLAAVGYDEKLQAAQAPGVAENIARLAIVLVLVGAVVMAVCMLIIYNLGKNEVEDMNKALGRSDAKIDVNSAIENIHD